MHKCVCRPTVFVLLNWGSAGQVLGPSLEGGSSRARLFLRMRILRVPASLYVLVKYIHQNPNGLFEVGLRTCCLVNIVRARQCCMMDQKDPRNALTIAGPHSATLAATNLAQIALLEGAQPSIGSAATQCSPNEARPFTAGPEFTGVSISAWLLPLVRRTRSRVGLRPR